MARITFGLATSHGPLLSTPPEEWEQRVTFDRQNTSLAFRGGTYGFDELAALREDEGLRAQSALETRVERHARCQTAIAALADALSSAKPDVLLLFGNDQREIFTEALTPTFAVFNGGEVENFAVDDEELARLKPGLAVAHWANVPERTATYPCVPELGEHLLASLTEDGFDVAAMKSLPKGPGERKRLPHAFGFLYRRIMNDTPTPAVPIVLNTFFPPNQPSVSRCFAFGKAIGRAVASWPSDRRVGVVMSGGLSHFVIDEVFDHDVLEAMAAGDERRLSSFPPGLFRSGTSETKNWIAGVGALADTDLEMHLIDYVPCYRSEAGTGNAMAFATWNERSGPIGDGA